jgi:predicted CoA-substrate-specific enzyme activase
MITAGIDVGIENLKVVILKDGKIISKGIGASGGANRGKAAQQIWQEACQKAQLSVPDIKKVVATGQGKLDVGFAQGRVVEPVADAQAARFLYPQCTSVVDIGADQTRVIALGDGNSIREVALNEKCAAGLGIFLKFMARKLEMTIDEMSHLHAGFSGKVMVNDGCSVFSELDSLGLLNRNCPREEVAMAIIEAVALRVNSVLNDKIKPARDTTVLVGGVSRNAAVVEALKRLSCINFLIPEQAEYAGAIGAALIAAS